MNKRNFLRKYCPKLHQLEKRADGVIDYREQQKIRAVSEEIRLLVCEVSDAIDNGEQVGARIERIKSLIKRAL